LNLSADTFSVINDYTFDGCILLSSIQLPGTLKIINQGAFNNCTHESLSITIPDGVETIASNAF
jgi:hypothetical protein